ncbi:MAG: SDR family NAD(P)-dependent oxidoreductase [Syntrophobacteraceae bacterium]
MEEAANDLRGKTLILTGASTGIGRALAPALASRGVNLVLNARSEALLLELRDEVRSEGVEAEAMAGSCAESAVVSELVRLALGIGHFRGFIHAAGVLHPGPFLWELSLQQFQDVFDASVAGAFQLVRQAVPVLRERGAAVAVFFGSGASERQTEGIGAYGAAKAAEEHLAKQLAVEAPEVTTFIFRPGVVETRMQQQAREARGGASAVVREFFHGFRDRGELISTETAAQCLVNILLRGAAPFHGGIATWRDGL